LRLSTCLPSNNAIGTWHDLQPRKLYTYRDGAVGKVCVAGSVAVSVRIAPWRSSHDQGKSEERAGHIEKRLVDQNDDSLHEHQRKQQQLVASAKKRESKWSRLRSALQQTDSDGAGRSGSKLGRFRQAGRTFVNIGKMKRILSNWGGKSSVPAAPTRSASFRSQADSSAPASPRAESAEEASTSPKPAAAEQNEQAIVPSSRTNMRNPFAVAKVRELQCPLLMRPSPRIHSPCDLQAIARLRKKKESLNRARAADM